MIEFLIYRNASELGALAEAWDDLRKQELRYYPSFSEMTAAWQAAPTDFRVMVARDDSGIAAIACFRNGYTIKKYAVGERKLFTLPFRETALVGSSVLGRADAETISVFLKSIMKEWHFDLVTLGEVIINSPLYKAATSLKGGTIVSRAERKNSIRWSIRLPKSFDDYLTSLRPTTRKRVIRDIRRFERDYRFETFIIYRPEQIDKFLRDGEKISRLTYQWNVGQRLCDDEATRHRYMRLANNGQLRCYILYVDGRPVAFAPGELSGHIFNYETPGFDPEFDKVSPGTFLLMYAIRDLIENTNCKVFDFGVGGDESGYKSRFGTDCINCTSIQLGKLYKPYSLILVLFQEGLSLVKNLGSAVIGHGRLRRQLKKAARQYGDS